MQLYGAASLVNNQFYPQCSKCGAQVQEQFFEQASAKGSDGGSSNPYL